MDTDEIHVERASVNDASEILEVQKAAFLGQARIYNNFNLPPLTQSLESMLEEFNHKVFLNVLLNGQIIASVRFQEVDGHVTIERLVVKPEYQNNGIGTILMKEVESKVLDAVSFNLSTGNKSIRNIHVYEQIGYKIVNTETTDQGIELLYMLKKP